MVFIKKSNVWMAKANGSSQVRVTRDGTRGNPYYSPSIADNGTIVALRSIFLHSFRPDGRRIVRPRQWAINPSPSLSTEPFFVDLSPNGRIAATENAVYSTFYDPRSSESRPTVSAWFTDFFDFRKSPPKEIGLTDGFYDYHYPAWIDSQRVLSTSYGIFNAQIFTNRVGQRTRGVEFYRDPGRDPATGTNSYILADAEATRARNKFAVMRRPLQVDTADLSVATIQIYTTGDPVDRLGTPLRDRPRAQDRPRARPVLVARRQDARVVRERPRALLDAGHLGARVWVAPPADRRRGAFARPEQGKSPQPLVRASKAGRRRLSTRLR